MHITFRTKMDCLIMPWLTTDLMGSIIETVLPSKQCHAGYAVQHLAKTLAPNCTMPRKPDG